MGYSVQLKQTVLQKVFSGNKTHIQISKEFGIGRSTIGKWLRDYRKGDSIKVQSTEKRPKDWTAEERISALITTGAMSPEEQSAWCRQHGIFSHHLQQWKQDAVTSMTTSPRKGPSETEKQLQKELSALKKDLIRKEKALAETAALLVLKKKAQAIWGEPEED
nr:transposase [uncultured Desulfobacter sp.]